MGALQPPVPMALARNERELPTPDPRWSYEPKFDGWRALLFTRSGFVQSRNGNNLAARFPEIVAAASPLDDLVLDGELVALRAGKLDFGALAGHASSRAAAGVVVYFVAFDLLADQETDWRPQPYAARRRRLEQVLATATPPVQLVPVTTDQDQAGRWMDPAVAQVGIEGVVVKSHHAPYREGRTGDWRKVRQKLVIDAVVIGVTGPITRPEELVLARPDDTGTLHLIGLSLPLPPAVRTTAGEHVTSTGEPRSQLPGGILGHPGTEYQPVLPTLIIEAETEPTVVTFSNRLRPRIHRLRPDLTVKNIDTGPTP